MKMNSVKEDILQVRQDFASDVDSLRLSLEKKADWESLRKGFNFFEDKLKEVAVIINSPSFKIEDK